MKIELGKRWHKELASRIGGYRFEVGVLEDKPYREPVEHGLYETPNLATYAKGPVRRATRKRTDKTVGEILVENQERLNIDLLREPFQKKNSDIIKFTQAFLKSAVAKQNPKRIANLLQAIVRNPILRQEYGPNSSTTADNKGFDRHLIDTAQMFKAIRARVKRVVWRG